MIEDITLRNFRSWRDEHRIALRPLTFLYGPNSSGKSSILTALSLLRQTLEQANGLTVSLVPVGDHTDVGDFRTLVHNHETDRVLTIGISYRVNAAEHSSLHNLSNGRRVTADFVFDDTQSSKCVLSRFTLEIEGQSAAGKADAAEDQVSPSLSFERIAGGGYRLIDFNPLYRLFPQPPQPASDSEGDSGVILQQQTDRLAALLAIPSVTVFSFVQGFPAAASTSQEQLRKYEEGENDEEEDRKINANALIYWYELWARLCQELAQELRAVLSLVRHLGPIRKPPERVMLGNAIGGNETDVGPTGEYILRALGPSVRGPENDIDAGKTPLLASVNHWLKANDYGYTVDIGHGGDAAVGDIAWLKLKDSRLGIEVSPKDVGSGISQSLPIIVQLMAAQQQKLIMMIEQHEVHLHPRLVVKITQLMCDTVQAQVGSQVICETHSPEAFLRLANRVALKEIDLTNVSVLFVAVQVAPGLTSVGSSELVPVPLNKYGGLDDDWPDPNGFFRERLDETRVKR